MATQFDMVAEELTIKRDLPDNKIINSIAVDSQVCSLNFVKKYRGFSENSLVA